MRDQELITVVGGKKRRHRVDVFARRDDTILAFFCPKIKTYELPGGGVDQGEAYEQSGIREAHEESGWIVENPYVVNLPGDWVFKGVDDKWFSRGGWQEELQIPIVCDAVRYEPSDVYGSEGDGMLFSFVEMPRLLLEWQFASGRDGIWPRKQLQIQQRIEVLKKLLADVQNRPAFENW